MTTVFASIQEKLIPFENLFYTWLVRVFLAATIAGVAWIDDAPPLELAAYAISIYTALRILMHFGEFMTAAPFGNRILQAISAVSAVLLLTLAFPSIAIFTRVIAEFITL